MGLFDKVPPLSISQQAGIFAHMLTRMVTDFRYTTRMDDTTFHAARRLAARTKRPDTAFALIMALLCLDGPKHARELAKLIGVRSPALSATARELEKAEVVTRKSSLPRSKIRRRPASSPAPDYALRADWKDKAFALPVLPKSGQAGVTT
jgi:hypothetical protein